MKKFIDHFTVLDHVANLLQDLKRQEEEWSAARKKLNNRLTALEQRLSVRPSPRIAGHNRRVTVLEAPRSLDAG